MLLRVENERKVEREKLLIEFEYELQQEREKITVAQQQLEDAISKQEVFQKGRQSVSTLFEPQNETLFDLDCSEVHPRPSEVARFFEEPTDRSHMDYDDTVSMISTGEIPQNERDGETARVHKS